MFERLNTPQEAYNFKLGAALKMEHTVLEMLEDLQDKAEDEKLKEQFRHHHQETQEHIANLERVFGLFGWEVDDSPCPAIEAIDKEGKTNIKKTDSSLVDSVILQGAVETEHHEIAVYENLIINAQAMGRDDVAQVLQQNLAQEQHTLDEVRQLQRQVAAVTPKQPA
jgi:ferritin-like metal-binding protein YciE